MSEISWTSAAYVLTIVIWATPPEYFVTPFSYQERDDWVQMIEQQILSSLQANESSKSKVSSMNICIRVMFCLDWTLNFLDKIIAFMFKVHPY